MPFILPDALTEDRKRRSSMINCRSDPSLVSYRHLVGYCRSPGNLAFRRPTYRPESYVVVVNDGGQHPGSRLRRP